MSVFKEILNEQGLRIRIEVYDSSSLDTDLIIESFSFFRNRTCLESSRNDLEG